MEKKKIGKVETVIILKKVRERRKIEEPVVPKKKSFFAYLIDLFK